MATSALITQEPYPRTLQGLGRANIGADDRFTLTGLQPGFYFLTVRSQDGRQAELITDAREPSPGPLTIRLNAGQTITGRVLNEDGTPAPHVPISIERPTAQRLSVEFLLANMSFPTTDAAGSSV